MWQTECNNGGEHRFGEADTLGEEMCEVCLMTANEVSKRRMCNLVERLTGFDPYTDHARTAIKRRLTRALKLIKKIETLVGE